MVALAGSLYLGLSSPTPTVDSPPPTPSSPSPHPALPSPHTQLVPWCLVHPRLVLVTVRPTRLVLVTIGLLNFSTHIFLVPVSFSPRIFRPPLGEGGLIVTCDSWSNLMWQLVQLFFKLKLGPIVTRFLVADDRHFFQPILLKIAIELGLLNFSTHIFWSLYSLVHKFFVHPWGEGGIIVTSDSWSNLVWQ